MGTYEELLKRVECDSAQSIDPHAETMQDIVRCIPCLWDITEHQIQELRKGHLLHLGIAEYGVFVTLANPERGGEMMTKDGRIKELECRIAELETENEKLQPPKFSELPEIDLFPPIYFM